MYSIAILEESLCNYCVFPMVHDSRRNGENYNADVRTGR